MIPGYDFLILEFTILFKAARISLEILRLERRIRKLEHHE